MDINQNDKNAWKTEFENQKAINEAQYKKLREEDE